MNCFIVETIMARKKLPTKVYVLGHEYIVEEMSEKLFKEREAYGDCCNDQKKIRIYCGVAPSVIRDTLLHEILHAMWHLTHIQSHDDEEKVVSRVSTALIGFLDDPRNDKIITLIMNI